MFHHVGARGRILDQPRHGDDQRAERLPARSCSATATRRSRRRCCTTRALWEQSGHWGKYEENMFLVLDNETREHDFSLKPMNCPSHYLMYLAKKHSYRELPLRYEHLRRAAPQRGLGHAVGPHAGAPVPAGRLPHLPDGEPDRGRGASGSWTSSSGITGRSASRRELKFCTRPADALGDDTMWDHAEAALRGALEATGLPYATQRRGTARSTGPRSTSTSTTRSAGRGSSAPSSSTTLRPERFELELHRRRQHAAPAGGDPSRGLRLVRAVHGDPDRALRRRVPAVAGAGAGARAADHRRPARRRRARCTSGCGPPGSARTSTSGTRR